MKKLSVEDIWAGKERPSPGNCAFCDQYYWVRDCEGCPVKKHTGKSVCEDTPYRKAMTLYKDIQFNYHRRLSDFRKAVQAEIDFLEGLSCE